MSFHAILYTHSYSHVLCIYGSNKKGKRKWLYWRIRRMICLRQEEKRKEKFLSKHKSVKWSKFWFFPVPWCYVNFISISHEREFCKQWVEIALRALEIYIHTRQNYRRIYLEFFTFLLFLIKYLQYDASVAFFFSSCLFWVRRTNMSRFFFCLYNYCLETYTRIFTCNLRWLEFPNKNFLPKSEK